jgi:RsiW-degrading membrane proteinase PrsW (M82 family)
MKNSVLIVIGIFLSVVIAVSVFVSEPEFSSLDNELRFELQSNQPQEAELTFYKLLLRDPQSIDLHYQYIENHFDIPAKKKIGKRKYEYRDDATILLSYTSLTHHDSIDADIGNYGLGLIYSNQGKFEEAFEVLMNVKNRNLKYLNNSIGVIQTEIINDKEAEASFRKEIANNGNVDGAYSNLIDLLYKNAAYDELRELASNPNALKYFSAKEKRRLYLMDFNLQGYFSEIIIMIADNLNIWGFFAAFLIMISWIFYLRALDIFEKEKWRYIILTVLLGMLFSFLTFPLSDFNNLALNFSLNGNVINDFFYSVIGIGAVEELAKIIPLLLMLTFTNEVNEPYDYIKYASLSALGFAFIENIIYFDESSLHIIHGRALISTVSHMFDSSIIAYGLILAKYKMKGSYLINFILFFALAALAHGFYDIWLINATLQDFSMITIIFFILSLSIWNSFKNNALNNSTFFNAETIIVDHKIYDYLISSLSLILLTEYLILALKFSPKVANNALLASLFSGAYLILLLSGILSRFTLQKGLWEPIKFFRSKKDGQTLNEK